MKAYSDTNNLDPFLEVGITDLLKDKMEIIQEHVEQRSGYSIHYAQAEQLKQILEIDYFPAWIILTDENFDSTVYKAQEEYQALGNYQEGQVMLGTSWHQGPPYNDDCPMGPCLWPEYNNFNLNTLVGCVAVAGAQTMRYWSWPPYGRESPYNDSYDWFNMCRWYDFDIDDDRFYDENGNPVTSAQIDAVAELCHEVGLAAGMNYGCSESGANFANNYAGKDLLDAFEKEFRFRDNADNKNRGDESAAEWFNLIKEQLNVNMPIPYRVHEHAIVADGWQEIGSLKQYHMNYGWGREGTCQNGCNTWYTLDALHLSVGDDEEMIVELYPETSLGNRIYGTYGVDLLFPYRYFNVDCTNMNLDPYNPTDFDATFSPLQNLQFLPGVKLKGNPIRGTIKFMYNNKLYSIKGTQKGEINISTTGSISILPNGSIKFFDR